MYPLYVKPSNYTWYLRGFTGGAYKGSFGLQNLDANTSNKLKVKESVSEPSENYNYNAEFDATNKNRVTDVEVRVRASENCAKQKCLKTI